MKLKNKLKYMLIFLFILIIDVISLVIPISGELTSVKIDLDEIKKNPDTYISFDDAPSVLPGIDYPIIYTIDPNNRENHFIEGRNADTWEKTDDKELPKNQNEY
jgi:hypothetical protein